MNSTQVCVKFPAEVKTIAVSFADVLINGEEIVSGSLMPSEPTGLTVSASGFSPSTITVIVGAGSNHQSYGVQVSANTDQGHVYTKTLAVVLNSDLASNYQNTNDQAFNALVGKLDAGSAALGKANFMFPAGFNATTGYISWELVDQDGIIHAQGQAFDYEATIMGQGVKVEAQAVINAPSNLIPTLSGQVYQVRWTLTINGQVFYSFEGLEVTSINTVPVGCEDTVEMWDTPTFHVNLVTEQPYDKVTVEIYKQNEKVVQMIGATPIQTADGWQYSAEVSGVTDVLTAALEPYTLIWSCSNLSRPNHFDRQTGRLFMTNASILQASEDMRIMISKSRATIFGTNDILFTVPILLSYLRRGRDAFNVAYGMFTGFTMMNASGGVREYWLKFSELMALRAQYLAEGEKVFNFSGQAISLDVDRTQFYDSMANTIQQQLDNEGKLIKQNLIKKGIIGGDGDVSNPQIARYGAGGSLAITISPASNFGNYSKWGLRGRGF